MIKKRIIQVLEFKGIAKEEFYKKIGVTSANFRGKASETPVSSKTIENILSEISDLNLDWLFTGEGDILKKEKNSTEQFTDLENALNNVIDSQGELLTQQKKRIEHLEEEIKRLTKK